MIIHYIKGLRSTLCGAPYRFGYCILPLPTDDGKNRIGPKDKMCRQCQQIKDKKQKSK